MEGSFELGIVIPVYNEEKSILKLLYDWQEVFISRQIQYRFFVVDDGSKDNSPVLLSDLLAKIPGLQIFTQSNKGHGASIMEGYRMASNGEWVFQIDADHQFETSAFGRLWENRENFDLLLAEREEKKASVIRKIISFCSRWMVRLLYGGRINDVNSPYRLMRNDSLKKAIAIIPPESFAPNVLLSSYFIAKKARIFTTYVRVNPKVDTKKSTLSRGIFKGSVKAFFQAFLFRFRL